MMRCMVAGFEDERCDCRCARNLVKGEDVVSASLNWKSGCVERGMKCIFEGEGRMRRLERSKSWQNVDVLWFFSVHAQALVSAHVHS